MPGHDTQDGLIGIVNTVKHFCHDLKSFAILTFYFTKKGINFESN